MQTLAFLRRGVPQHDSGLRITPTRSLWCGQRSFPPTSELVSYRVRLIAPLRETRIQQGSAITGDSHPARRCVPPPLGAAGSLNVCRSIAKSHDLFVGPLAALHAFVVQYTPRPYNERQFRISSMPWLSAASHSRRLAWRAREATGTARHCVDQGACVMCLKMLCTNHAALFMHFPIPNPLLFDPSFPIPST